MTFTLTNLNESGAQKSSILTPSDFAALEIAARPWDKVRGELAECSDYDVDRIIRLRGSFRIGAGSTVNGPADYLTVLAWILAKLPAGQKAAVADAVRAGIDVTRGQLDLAKEICEPTRKTSERRGSLTGQIKVEVLE